MRSWNGALAIVLVAAAAAPARASRAMTLAETIATALHQSPRLGAATMDLIAAEGDEAVASQELVPTIGIDVSGARTRADGRPAPVVQELSSDRLVFELTLQKRFVHGGTVALSIHDDFADVVTRIPNQETYGDRASRTSSPRVSARWTEPLWGGRRHGAAILERAAALRGAAVAARDAAAIGLVRDVERAYWQLYLAERELAIRTSLVEVASEQLRVVRAEIERGARPRNAEAEIAGELARRREDALVAEGTLADRSIDLATLVGLEPTTDLRATDRPPPLAPRPGPRIDPAREPSTRALDLQADAASAELDRVVDDTRWQVAAYVAGSAAADGDRLGEALDRMAGYGGWTVQAGLTLQAPLVDHARDGARRAARARLLAARIRASERAAAVTAEAAREEQRLAIAAARRETLERAIAAAEANLAAETGRWERGDTTAYELLRRQAALADARLAAERARIDELAAAANRRALDGTLQAEYTADLP